MYLKEQLIQEIHSFNNPTILLQIFDFIELIKQNSTPLKKNNPILEMSGCLSNEEALAMQEVIQKEFNQIEGEW